MALEEQIIDWSASRPSWQRAVLRRVAKGEVISEREYDQIIDAVVASEEINEAKFGLAELPETSAGDAPVRLVSIASAEHVNALRSDEPLTFEPTGLTIIYGDNASGKSGYARLLKRIARARHQEEILSDVFDDTALAKPTAALTVAIGDVEQTIAWPESTPPDLQRMLFYDQACGNAYISFESDFPYRPSALFVMDGLIQACITIRNRIDARLLENASSAKTLPAVEDDTRETVAGKYLASLSGSSSPELLDALLTREDLTEQAVGTLKNSEVRLRGADTTNERQKLIRQASKLDSISSHLQTLEGSLGNDAAMAIQRDRNQLKNLEEAGSLFSKIFESEPISGIGTSAWKDLWESARRFSEAHAYTEDTFPVVADGTLCVLCEQRLDGEARTRFSKFERFVQDDTQTRLRDARAAWDARVRGLADFRTMPENIDTHLKDLQTDYPELISEVQEIITKYESARMAIVDRLSCSEDIPGSGITVTETTLRLQTNASAAKTEAEGLSDPGIVKARLKAVEAQRKELELLQSIKTDREFVIGEIKRLKEREALESVKSAAATGPITKKILDLSEASITEVVRDTFTRETERLHLDRVTIAMTRGERGTLLHQPKLVGARQEVTLPRVFSEGERTALGLAAFFTEAHLDASRSAIILDDPVTSLDHIRRGLVATRLASLAETRQVVIFTHDISFVADLKREAKGIGVQLAERSVVRPRGAGKKPGACGKQHPWKARDVAERLGDLRTELARIKKECGTWDDTTTYENEVATWAGNLSETWERIFSQEIVGPILAEGGLEVRPMMVKILVRFTESDESEFQASYGRVSQWAKRHDKSGVVNYVAPDVSTLEEELARVANWFARVKKYRV